MYVSPPAIVKNTPPIGQLLGLCVCVCVSVYLVHLILQGGNEECRVQESRCLLEALDQATALKQLLEQRLGRQSQHFLIYLVNEF